MMVVKNIDHLFSKPNYSAVIAGKTLHKNWNKLNSGLMVIEPSISLFKKLCANMEKLLESKKNNIGDQDVFIRAYKNWENNKQLLLPEIYNVLFNEMRYFLLLSKYRTRDMYVIHFAGRTKPWDKKYKFKVIGYLLLLRIKQLYFLNKYKNYFN